MRLKAKGLKDFSTVFGGIDTKYRVVVPVVLTD